MADASQNAQDQQAYATIRQVASGQLKMWFDGVAFEPLFGEHHDIVSVTARPFVGGRPGEPLWLTVWEGYRDGTGEDGSDEGLWLLIEQTQHLRIANPTWRRNANPVFLSITPEAPELGLTLPDLQVNEESLLELIGDMLKLLAAGIPVHRRRARQDEAFDALNEAVQGDEVPELEDGEGEVLVEELEQLCSESDLDSVEFTSRSEAGGELLATSSFLDVGEQVQLTIWTAADGVDWIEVAGRVQRMDSPELVFPGENQDEADMVADLADQLAQIHEVACAIFDDLEPADPSTAFALLNSVAYGAMNSASEGPGPHTRRWHVWADQFGGHCKLGFLAGVMLEESPFGNLNIRATTMDPITRATTDLQVFWKQDDEADIPEHWLAVGTAAAPAHDGDPEHPELLAGISTESRDYIRHAIDHLHEMVHLAGNVLEARGREVLAFVEARMELEAVPDTVRDEMYRTAIDDAITGLNGIARLYTGAMPS